MTPEWSRIERVDTIGEQSRHVTISADVAESAALARRFGLIGIERLDAGFALYRQPGAIVAEGQVSATVTQACSATGAPMVAEVDEKVTLRFVEALDADEEMELSADALDTLPIENGAIDLGEAAAETMALALDPFPRSPAAAQALAEAGVIAEGEEVSGAFGALARLKQKMEE